MRRLQDQDQDESKEKEDQLLGDIELHLGSLKHKAGAIGDELQDQNRMLEDTTDQAQHTQDKLDTTNSRVDRLNEKLAECCGFGSLKNKIFVLAILFFIFMILLFLITMGP